MRVNSNLTQTTVNRFFIGWPDKTTSSVVNKRLSRRLVSFTEQARSRLYSDESISHLNDL